MLLDQMITVLSAIAVPLLLMNLVGIARSAYATSCSIAGGAAHIGWKTCGLLMSKADTTLFSHDRSQWPARSAAGRALSSHRRGRNGNCP